MLLNEEIHEKLREVINNPDIPSHGKHKAMASLYRTLLKKGIDTGLENSKPKKGSSRAVYFPSEPDDITIDGTPTKMHSVLKIAYPGYLDKYNDSGSLFGEHQNLKEGDRYIQHMHSVLRPTDDGKYEYNENGILAPVIHTHEDGHYLHMGRIDKIGPGEFKALTKTEGFPKGISHQDFYDALNHEYAQANPAYRHYTRKSDEALEKIKEHPLVQAAQNFVFDNDAHPVDFHKGNMGIWTHPVTGKKHIVISDYGYDGQLAKEYQRARNRQIVVERGY